MRKGNPTLRLMPLFTSMAEQGIPPGFADGQDPAVPVVGACRIGDLRALRSLDEVQIFHQPEALLSPYSALRHGVQSVLPMSRDWPRLYVARQGKNVLGFVDFQPVPPDRRWHLTAVGTSASAHRSAVLEALLHHGIRAAGAQGVKRLYARLRPELEVSEIAHALGFSSYAEEIIFTARPTDWSPASAGTRMQEQADTWAIHQLYNATVPREVQYAEAFTSHCWDVNMQRATAQGTVHGRVLDNGHQLAGYVRVVARAGTYVIELMVGRDDHDVAGRLLDDVLSDIDWQHAKRIYCVIRTYQQHLRQPLEDRGFDPVWMQQLQVKYTTATARVPVGEAVVLQADVRERVPKRVPTFLQRPGQDESAPMSR
jgi:hypothetical protein